MGSGDRRRQFDFPQDKSISIEVDRNGTVTYRERFDGVYSNDFELRKFPFDTQVLRFEFQPFLSTASQIRFAPQALPGTGMSPGQHTELAAWHMEDLTYTADKVTGDPFLPDDPRGALSN